MEVGGQERTQGTRGEAATETSSPEDCGEELAGEEEEYTEDGDCEDPGDDGEGGDQGDLAGSGGRGRDSGSHI